MSAVMKLQLRHWHLSRYCLGMPLRTQAISSVHVAIISRHVHCGRCLSTVNRELQKKLKAVKAEQLLQSARQNTLEAGKKGNQGLRSGPSVGSEYRRATSRTTRILFYSLPVVFVVVCAAVSRFLTSKTSKGSTDGSGASFLTAAYSTLPLNALSRFAGRLCSCEMPRFARSFVYGAFVRATDLDMNEAVDTDLRNYESLSALFTRQLKPELRKVESDAIVVSPCDGVVLHSGVVRSNQIYQVKGACYRLMDFLGPVTWGSSSAESKSISAASFDEYLATLKLNPQNDVYYVNLYLAPGNYHRFHSPADWKVFFRRHFPGALLSVRQGIAANFDNLYSVNERVAYVGSWQHGFFSMSAVGATGVGNIRILFDDKLVTNKRRADEAEAIRSFEPTVAVGKGNEFGAFNFGSTIVLIFEAPPGLKFAFDTATGAAPIRYGQALLMRPAST